MEKEKRSEVLWVDPATLEVEKGFNVRFDYGDIDGLSASILENGVKVPLRVKLKDKKTNIRTIIDGHRRFKAIQKLVTDGYTDFLVPIMVEPATSSNEEERTLSMITLNEGKPLTMLEEAEVYRRLNNFKWSPTDISKRVGKSVTHINNCLLLVTASKKLKDQIIAGKISASAVVESLKKSDDQQTTEKELTEKIDSSTSKITPRHIQKPKDTQSRGAKFTLENLSGIYETLDNMEGDRNDAAFETLQSLIKWGEGRLTNSELSLIFFKPESSE